MQRSPPHHTFRLVFILLIVGILLRFFVVSVYRIPTNALAPKLLKGDFVVVYRAAYGVPNPFSVDHAWETRSPERGDIVVFRHPTDLDTLYIRDVVGRSGDRIEVKNGEIWINDNKSDQLISKSAKLQQAAFVVLPGHFVVSDLGDGLQYWGMVPEKNLEGRAQFVLFSLRWPPGDGLPRPRIRRFFQAF